jgi:asparagine synthetase B (glutamine-hydrolysing)
MSWIVGFRGDVLNPERKKRLDRIAGEPLFSEVKPEQGLYLAAGGLAATCRAGRFSDPQPGGWVALGIGLRTRDDHCEVLGPKDWQRRLRTANDAPAAPDGLDGHFVTLRWERGQPLVVASGPMGLRTLYFTELPGGTTFSTRLDWLARLRSGAEIDYETFGGQWLLFSPLTCEAPVQDVGRLGPGGQARLDADGTLTTQAGRPFSVDFDRPATPDELDRRFAALTRPTGKNLSLGLSGGLDSRLLLAFCGSRERAGCAAHVWGPPDHPDVRVARRVARDGNVSMEHFHEPPPTAPDEALRLLRAHLPALPPGRPASSVLRFRHHPELQAQGKLMIDGGVGGLMRGRLLRRVLYPGRRALRSGDPERIFPYLRKSADPDERFKTGPQKAMRRGALRQTKAAWQTLPDQQDVGARNLLDLFYVRAPLPASHGISQHHLDALIPNFMPYVQPSFLKTALRLPAKMRRNRLMRRFIRRRFPALAQHPLVMSTTYPFWMNDLPALAWTKLKARLTGRYQNRRRGRLLQALRPFVEDVAHGRAVQQDPALKADAIQQMVRAYYEEGEGAAALDQWLGFWIWREAITGKE